MTAIDQQRGSASSQEEIWRARDYAELQEGVDRADYLEGLRRIGIRPGSALLDVGCGPGGFCRLAGEAGATVTGLDASPSMLEVARERVPDARFDVGDMQHLPYGEDSFDVVTLFNSLQFCSEPLAALTEVRRVAKPGTTVFMVVFGREDHVELTAKFRALSRFLPPNSPGAPGPMALSGPCVLDGLVERSGLTPTDAGYLQGRFEFPDEATMLRGQRSTLLAVLAERTAGEEAVREAILRAYAPYRTASGGYRLEVEWRYLEATA
jgi:SAM-dependent methyltransferase